MRKFLHLTNKLDISKWKNNKLKVQINIINLFLYHEVSTIQKKW